MKFRPNFLKRAKDVFLVAKNFGRTLYWEPFSRFFILSAKRKNPKGTLRFFVLTGIFYFADSFLRTVGAASKVWLRPSI